jgi:hypothetical protein
VYEDLDEKDMFVHTLIEFLLAWTNFDQYEKMSNESRAKWRERLTIMACKEFSPRKNYDISKETVRRLVADIIEANRGQANE